VPFFCGVGPDLRAQAFTAAVMAGSPCHFLDELTRWQDTPAADGSGAGPGTWDLMLREKVFPGLPDPGTLTMRRNVALAVLALSELETGLGLTLLPAQVGTALGNLFLPGRYQTVLSAPDWIFDTAHNTQALENVWREFAGRPGPGRKVVVFGSMYDKDAPADAGALLAGCDALIGVPVTLPRSRTCAELEDLFRGWGRDPVAWPATAASLPDAAVAPDIPQALRLLARLLRPEDAVLVTGSCFTVAEVLYRLGFKDLEATRTTVAAAGVLDSMGDY